MEKKDNFGLHILQRIGTSQYSLLTNLSAWVQFMKKNLALFQIEMVGESSYSFAEGGGFTVALCLAESHICIHTWPEIEMLTFDVYLCNYNQSNEEKVRAIAAANLQYWNGVVQQQHEIQR
jgi:S-adenosylmethionine decarboxylase